MAKSMTLVSLPQLIDVSLNVHEGIINFQALHTFLHVMLQQLGIGDVAVEFRGSDSDKIQSLITGMKQTTNLYPEYSIVGGQKSRKAKGLGHKKISLQDVIKSKSDEIKAKEQEIQVIERRKDSKEDPVQTPPPLKSPQGSLLGLKAADVKTVVVVDSQSSLPQFSVAITKNSFDELRANIQQVKDQIRELTELPANLGLLESIKGTSTPIVDMFQTLTLVKRMDANEAAIEKLSSLIEDVAKMSATVSEMPTQLQNKLKAHLEEQLQEVKAAASGVAHDVKPKQRPSLARPKKQSVAPPVSKDSSIINMIQAKIAQLDNEIQQLKLDVEALLTQTPKSSDMNEEGFDKPPAVLEEEEPLKEPSLREPSLREPSLKEPSVKAPSIVPPLEEEPERGIDKGEFVKVLIPQGPFVPILQNLDLSELAAEDAFALIQQEFANLQNWMTDNFMDVERKVLLGGGGGPCDTHQLEDKLTEYHNKLKEMNSVYNQQIGLLNQQYNSVQNDMADVLNKLEIILPGGDSTGIGAETTMDLANKLSILEQEMIAISDHADKLEAEKLERDKQTEAILEQIDVLKIVKANREDLEDALGEKADACMINRKVSHDQFDAACDDLTRGIEEALGKLEEQEELWRQALESIHQEVGKKLDKLEVDPLRDFVNSKLKALQDKFKALTNLKREHEAAGTKNKLLRNVNCISCDRDVVMRKEMDVTLKPKPYAMPPNRNMAPYLAYELDNLRKQQKCAPGSKNLNFIETAIKTTRGQKDKDHICNRYCGGSHTVTTPQQRVTRLGHFLDQWGPEIAPLNDEYVKGNDNHMYKARDQSIYKGIKRGQGKNPKGGRESPVMEVETPQHDKETFISPAAQAAITKQESMASEQKNKQHSIGAMPLEGTTQRSSVDRQSPEGSP